MKRNHIKKYEYGVHGHYGLIFWKKCCACKKDFRREKGWCFMAGPYHGGSGRVYYLCASCAPSKEAANVIAIDGRWILPGPPGPPTPKPPTKAPLPWPEEPILVGEDEV